MCEQTGEETKPLGSVMLLRKYTVDHATSTMIGWTIGGRVNRKSNIRKTVTHLNTIPAIGGLISMLGPWFKSPFRYT